MSRKRKFPLQMTAVTSREKPDAGLLRTPRGKVGGTGATKRDTSKKRRGEETKKLKIAHLGGHHHKWNF